MEKFNTIEDKRCRQTSKVKCQMSNVKMELTSSSPIIVPFGVLAVMILP